jgi:hypothetical protein
LGHSTRTLAIATLLLAVAAGARAQSVQLTGFGGWDFGGSVRDTAFDQDRSFEAALAYGGAVSVPIGESWRFELLYSRQETRIEGGLAPAFDVTIERYLGGFQEEKPLGEGRARWFGTVWLGATRFVPGLGGFDAETKFGAGLGLGVKTFFGKNVGLRFETRGYWTLVSGEGGVACVNGDCLFAFSGKGLWQGDASAGLILAF